jgi:hypothetical protein
MDYTAVGDTTNVAARIDRLDEQQKRTVQIASVIGHEFALRLLRRVAEATDRVERALTDLKALEFARRLHERHSEAGALWILGEVSRQRGDRDGAARHHEQALGIADELGMRPLAGRCRESLAALA